MIFRIWQKISKVILNYNTKDKIAKFWSQKMTKFLPKKKRKKRKKKKKHS
jgi:hypothetical protein